MLRGRVWKDGKHWLIECPALDAMTQGRSKADALGMLADWVRTALDDPHFEVEVSADGGDQFVMRVEDPKPIMGLIIERARNAAGLTLEEVARKLKLKSKSNVKYFETGKNAVSIQKAQEILDALGFDLEINIRHRA